jgi:16S rRNA C967 or C1407 C5-methylase (RsmB/RsmF family)
MDGSAGPIPRYLRVNPRKAISITALRAELGVHDASNSNGDGDGGGGGGGDDDGGVVPFCNATALPGIFALHDDARVAQLPAYKAARVYGIDFASAVAALALDVSGAACHVLDLCCAPGAKLCLLGDLVAAANEAAVAASDAISGNNDAGTDDNVATAGGDKKAAAAAAMAVAKAWRRRFMAADSTLGSVTGVDVSRTRLNVARKAVLKYQVMRVRLFRSDGCTFAEPPIDGPFYNCNIADLGDAVATDVAADDVNGTVDDVDDGGDDENRAVKRPRHNVSDSSSSSSLPPPPPSQSPPRLYDRVLVDAECSHDGSMKHIAKFNVWGWDSFERRFLDPQRLASLQTLQRRLLVNGFRNLKSGGVLVYSTCSFCRAQNEDIVQWLLDTQPTAVLLPFCLPGVHDVRLVAHEPTAAASMATMTTATIAVAATTVATAATTAPTAGDANVDANELHYEHGSLRNTARFGPLISRTSGLFIARIGKRGM